jgi:hypothetical protein
MRKSLIYCPIAFEGEGFIEGIFTYKGSTRNGTDPTVSPPITDRKLFAAVLMMLLDKATVPGSKVGFVWSPDDGTHLKLGGKTYYTSEMTPRDVDAFRAEVAAERLKMEPDENFTALLHEADDFVSRLKAPMFGVV